VTIAVLALLGCVGSTGVADCAQPRLWYGPPGAEPPVFWGCAPPTGAWEVLPPGFLDPLDTGWVVVGNEVDWDVAWPERRGMGAGPPDTGAPGTGLTGDTAWPTGDTGFLEPLPRPRPLAREDGDTGRPSRAPVEPAGRTGFTGLTGATGVTGVTGDTGVVEVEAEVEAEVAGSTGDTSDTGEAPAPVGEAPTELDDPTDLVVPEGGPRYEDPRDLVVPEE